MRIYKAQVAFIYSILSGILLSYGLYLLNQDLKISGAIALSIWLGVFFPLHVGLSKICVYLRDIARIMQNKNDLEYNYDQNQ